MFAVIFVFFSFGPKWGWPTEKAGWYLGLIISSVVAVGSLLFLLQPIISIFTRPIKVKAVCVEVAGYRADSSSSNSNGAERAVYFATIQDKDYIFFDDTKNNLNGNDVGDVIRIRASEKDPYNVLLGFSLGKFAYGMLFFTPFFFAMCAIIISMVTAG